MGAEVGVWSQMSKWVCGTVEGGIKGWNVGLSVRVCKVQWLCVYVHNRPGLWCHFWEWSWFPNSATSATLCFIFIIIIWYYLKSNMIWSKRRKKNFGILQAFTSLSPKVVNSKPGGLLHNTCEELQVGKRFGQHPATLLLHWQRDDHKTVSQLREVFDEVVVPAERKRQTSENSLLWDCCMWKSSCKNRGKAKNKKGISGASNSFNRLQRQSWI